MDFDDEKVVVLANRVLNHISKSNKLLNSALKKSKVFVTRKLIRKLKDARENLNTKSADEGEESAERLVKRFLDRMKIIKLIKKSELAKTHLRQKISENHILKSHPLVQKLYLEILPPHSSSSLTNVASETVKQASEENEGHSIRNEFPESITPEDGYKMLKELEAQLVNQNSARSEFEKGVNMLVKLIEEKGDGDAEEEKNFHEESKLLTKDKSRNDEKSDHLDIKKEIPSTIRKKKINKFEMGEPNSKTTTHSSFFVASLADVSSSLETSDDDTPSDGNNNYIDDDDWSDPDFDKYYGGGAGGNKQRKNRMGQQARRLLWEKKYGEKANHLVASKGSSESQKSSAANRNRRGQQRRGVITNNNPQSHHKHDPGNEHKLHPSWEAKKHQNEKMNNLKFQGKKIVFNDDNEDVLNEDLSSKGDNAAEKRNIDDEGKSHTHWNASKRQKQL